MAMKTTSRYVAVVISDIRTMDNKPLYGMEGTIIAEDDHRVWWLPDDMGLWHYGGDFASAFVLERTMFRKLDRGYTVDWREK